MKTINYFKSIFAITVLSLVFAGSIMAGNPAQGLPKYQPIHDKLEKSIKFPGDCFTGLNVNEKAEVLFTLSDDGKVNVVEINCNCKELSESLKTQLEAIYCNDVVHEYNQHFKVTIHFRAV